MTSYSEYIVVNATALDRSGALSILKQFVENIPQDELKWLIFISNNISITSNNPNVRLEPISGVKPWFKRLLWDSFGLKKWLKYNNISPIASISLQNTGFRVGKKIPTFIYYHQPLPFYRYKWSIYNSQQRSLWFYKNLYPFFVKLFLKSDTKIFVQLNYIKQGFINRFNHQPENIEIYSPAVASIVNSESNMNLNANHLNLFYPAAPYFYKNHKVIENAVAHVKRPTTLYLTTNLYQDHKNIEDLGNLTFQEVNSMYLKCDALLFPSYIETFGLPLIEAALTGMPIIAADLPYAREVLDGYEGAVFIPYNSQKDWIDIIEKLEKGKRYKPLDISKRPSWNKLFESINKSI